MFRDVGKSDFIEEDGGPVVRGAGEGHWPHVPCLVFNNSNHQNNHLCPMMEGRDVWYHEAVAALPEELLQSCPIEWMNAEDPLFLLYTSGSTGKPKAILHTTAGYMVYAGTTFKYTFDYHERDVYFCTADVGWITGHSYLVYGPLLHGATSVLYEGLPNYPTASRWWEIIEKYQVSIFYTAPTAIRSLMQLGDHHVNKCNLDSLRVLGSVGEPINAEAWRWFYEVVGKGKADIVDTWWQTETGGHMITPLPGCTPLKPGCASLPFFGIQPVLLDPLSMEEKTGVTEGLLAIKAPWPGIARTLYNEPQKFEETYFSAKGGYYITGDGARRDSDGYIWITGRVDDVMNISGHRIGTSEVEDAVNKHPAVVESAVVGVPHDVKGESIYVFLTFRENTTITPKLLQEVKNTVRTVIGPLATPDVLHPAQTGLPKTRSGKIIRRVLRKIATEKYDDLGDVSTMANPEVIKDLIAAREKYIKPKAKV
ncbi:acetyl-CoA synthetase [Angomonas deanei]|nr:acetyl-CoA synthetase [Angomonas deanei]|eukprot:EPY31538.1 acetyl-CoA synthetase [Angomonas deanei]